MTDNDHNIERIALVEETLSVAKNVVETGRVRIRTFVDEEQVVLHDALARDIVDVERVAVGKRVEAAPSAREEGDFLIIPVIEERLVVEKHLFLVEELRIHRSTTSIPVDVPATRRVMRAVVEREDAATTEPAAPLTEGIRDGH